MSVFRFGAAQSPPRRPIVQGSEQSPFCTSPSQLQEVTLDPNMNFPGRSPGKTSPLRGHALKEYEEQLAHLKKENFNLKLRIYFLEERMGRMNADDKEEVIKKNIELRVEAESLRKDVSDKQELLCQAYQAVELLEGKHKEKLNEIQCNHQSEKGMLESRIQELQKEMKEYEEKYIACASHHTQEEVDQLQQKIEELEIQVNQLGCSVHNESERANNLDIDLHAVKQEAEQLNLHCQGLEGDLKQRDTQLNTLQEELEQKGQECQNCSRIIKTLEEVLSAKQLEIQNKVQELSERDGMLEEKRNKIEEQSKVLIEIQITLDEKLHQISALQSSLTTKDENIAALQNKLEKAKATSQNFETRLEVSMKELNKLREEVETLKSQHHWRYKKNREQVVQKSNSSVNENVSSADAGSPDEDSKRQQLAIELAEKEKKVQILEEKEKNSSLVLMKIRQELNQRDQEMQVLKSHMKAQGPKLNELEKKLKEKDEKIGELQVRGKKSAQTLQTFSKMTKDAQSDLKQTQLEVITKDKKIKELTSQCNALRDAFKKANEESRQVRTRNPARALGGSSSACDNVKDMAEEENEQLWAEVEEKNKKLLQLAEERDSLSIEKEKQAQSLLKRLTEKESSLEECEKRLEAVTKDIHSRDCQITELECELNELRVSLKEVQLCREPATYKEEGQQTDSGVSVGSGSGSLVSKAESDLTRELVSKKQEIERLNAELRKRTTNLQELVNKELWDKNREIEKLQDRLNITCERKEVEIVALRQQIEARDFQLKVLQDRFSQLAAQVNFSSPMVIKEVQPITLNNHLHIQQPDVAVTASGTVPSLEDEVSSLRQQLVSSVQEKKYLCQKLEELKEQLHNSASQESCENQNFSKSCLQCTEAKQVAEHAQSRHRETAEICAMLTHRLEELARFLSSLVKSPEFLGALGQKCRKMLKQVVQNSMELSRSLTVSFSEMHEPNNSILQMSSLSGFLECASEINLSLLKLRGDEGDDDTEADISCYESKLHNCAVSDNEICRNNTVNNEVSTCEQTQLIRELRSQVETLKEEIKRRDNEISQAHLDKMQEDSFRKSVNNMEESGISFILRVKDDHIVNKADSESSLNSMTFYNSHHSNNANEKWPKSLPLSLRKEDTSLHGIEVKDCRLDGHHKSSLFSVSGPRLSQSANTTPVKADSARSNCSQRIQRSSSANAVSGSVVHSANYHREYGVASLSESEAWSEPDRNVSMARIGLREDNSKANISSVAGSMNTTCCLAGSSGRARRCKDVDISSESSEETARENARTPGKRLRGDTGDMRRLQSKIRGLEQLNDALRAEVNILHQLTPAKGDLKVDNAQPLTRDISVNTSQATLDKSTSVEVLQSEDTSITVPAKLLEQIRYQREKLESSLFHNDFIRMQLEHIFVTLASSQGGDIGDVWQKLKETTEELCAARAKVQELQTEIAELENQLKDSKSKAQQLEDNVEQLQVTRKTMSLLKEQIAEFETKLKEKDNEILEQNCLLLETRNKNEEQLIDAKKSIEEANRSKEELKRQLQEADVLMTDSERRVQEAEHHLSECEAKLHHMEREKECIRNDMSEKVKKLELEIYEAEKRRNEAEIQVIEAKKQLQEEESKRYEAEWKLQELEEKLRLRESEYEKYLHEVLDRKVKEIELRANLQIREAEKRLEQKELYLKTETEKKVQEAERLGSEFEAGLRRQIEEAEKQGKSVRAEGEKKVKELEEKYKLRETELRKEIHEFEHTLWEKEAELRQQLDEATMKLSQTELERNRLSSEKFLLERELRRYEARETELTREKKEAENRLVLSKDKLGVKVLELEEKKNDLERRVKELEYINLELEQRLAKLQPIDNYHSQLNTSHLSGPYSSSFPYRKADTVSSSSGLDTYSGDGGSLPSSIWSLPPGTIEDVKRKEDNLKGDGSSAGLSALSTLVLQQGFSRQRSEMSDYMSEEPPVEEYEALFTQTCSSSWFSVGGQQYSLPENLPPDAIIPRNINSSPDLGIESDQGRFSSLETPGIPPSAVHLETSESIRNQNEVVSDLNISICTSRHLSGGELESEYARLLKENASLKRDLVCTKRSLQTTLSQLITSNQLKKQVEKAICKQLHKTHHILKQARRDDLDGGDVNFITTTAERSE